MELEGELNYLTQNQAKETTRFLNIKEELDNANTKVGNYNDLFYNF